MPSLDLRDCLVGARIHVDLSLLRPHYRKSMGRQAGDYAADATPVVWRCVFDDRTDGGAQSIVVEHDKPDGSALSMVLDLRFVRSAYRHQREAQHES